MAVHKTTIKDIANKAGVSIALVSFVMNNKIGRNYRVNAETAKKILAVAEELNYQPNNAARSLRSGRSRTIGVIVSDISNPFFADIARRIEDNAYKYNYTVFFGSSDENTSKLENLIDVMVNKGVDGLVVVPCHGSEEVIRKLAETSLPLVLLDRTISDLDVSNVLLNNKKAALLATDCLIRQGCRRIELISYSMSLSNIADREYGYQISMKAHGFGEYGHIHRLRFKDISDQMIRVLGEGLSREAEAFVFATNTLAVEGLKALNKMNVIVPRDVAVVGFDDSEAFDLYYTTLTHIKQPIEQFGYEVVELIVKAINQKDRSQCTTIVLNPELVEGNSSCRHVKRLF